jgi:HSP20 family molecular chaperone IbpA
MAATQVAISLAADVTILSGTQVIYDQSPKLRIKASGFSGVKDDDIKLDIGPTGVTLRANKDYLITKDDDDGLILKLLSNRR